MSSGFPDAIFALMRSASVKSLSFEAAWLESGNMATAAARMTCLNFMFVLPLNCSTCASGRAACRPFVDADGDDDDEADHQFLYEGRDAHENQAVAHDADDQHAENGPEDRAFAARQRSAADDCRGDDVEFEAEACAPGLTARQEGEAEDAGEGCKHAEQDEGPDLYSVDADAGDARRLGADAGRKDAKDEIRVRQHRPSNRGDDREEDELHRDDAEDVSLSHERESVQHLRIGAVADIDRHRLAAR